MLSQIEIVRDERLFKYLTIVFVAKNGRSQAGRDYGYLQLEQVPHIVEFDEDGVIS